MNKSVMIKAAIALGVTEEEIESRRPPDSAPLEDHHKFSDWLKVVSLTKDPVDQAIRESGMGPIAGGCCGGW